MTRQSRILRQKTEKFCELGDIYKFVIVSSVGEKKKCRMGIFELLSAFFRLLVSDRGAHQFVVSTFESNFEGN